MRGQQAKIHLVVHAQALQANFNGDSLTYLTVGLQKMIELLLLRVNSKTTRFMEPRLKFMTKTQNNLTENHSIFHSDKVELIR